MSKTLLSAALLVVLASCQSATAPTTAAPASPEATATTPAMATTAAPTAEAARAAVGRYLQAQPNASLYVLDSANVIDVDTHWQVLVPRTDWARRMPNKAAFEVEKGTGAVSTRPVK
jgi:hypothetical protein